jgi:hypothetical protein
MKIELIFNLEEVNMWQWEDWKDKKIIFPKMIDDQMMHHRASRNMRSISIITCITAGEESLVLYIVILQDSKPVC